MAEEECDQGAAAGMAISKGCSWRVIHGKVDCTVEVVVLEPEAGAEEVQQRLPGSISSSAGSLALEPSEDSGPCEITVEFQHSLWYVRSICILSTARKCEIYSRREPNGDAEYICTACAEPEELATETESGTRNCCEDTGPFYEAEVELVKADAWAGVKIRLLSLQNKSRADIKKISILAAPGPQFTCEDDTGKANNNSSLLTMLMPSVLQIVRGMSDGMESRRAGASEAAQSLPSNTRAHVNEDMESSSAGTSSCQEKPVPMLAEEFQNELRCRLQSLEMVTVRMESYLHVAFTKLDERMTSLEQQMSALQRQGDDSRVLNEERTIQETADPSSDEHVSELIDPPTVLDPATSMEMVDLPPLEDEDVGVTFEVDGEPDNDTASLSDTSSAFEDAGPVESSTSSTDSTESVGAGRSSLSLEDAWASALAAFSLSVTPQKVVQESRVEVANEHEPADAEDNYVDASIARVVEQSDGEASSVQACVVAARGPSNSVGRIIEDLTEENATLMREQLENAQATTSTERLVEENAEATTLIEQAMENSEQSTEPTAASATEKKQEEFDQVGSGKGAEAAEPSISLDADAAKSSTSVGQTGDLIVFEAESVDKDVESRKTEANLLLGSDDMNTDTAKFEIEVGQSADNSGGESHIFSDPLLIDCVDGVYLMRQTVDGKNAVTVCIEDGFDLIATTPVSDEEMDSASPYPPAVKVAEPEADSVCSDLLSI